MLLLNLCSGRAPRAGFVNVDYDDDLTEVDEYVDLNQLPWPWGDNEVDLIHTVNGG